MALHHSKRKSKIIDPVLPDQGGRLMPSDPVGSANPNREEAIRVKAYEIYEQRGRQEGHAIEDWLRAEAQLTGLRR
jgi:hypothetical protein